MYCCCCCCCCWYCSSPYRYSNCCSHHSVPARQWRRDTIAIDCLVASCQRAAGGQQEGMATNSSANLSVHQNNRRPNKREKFTTNYCTSAALSTDFRHSRQTFPPCTARSHHDPCAPESPRRQTFGLPPRHDVDQIWRIFSRGRARPRN